MTKLIIVIRRSFGNKMSTMKSGLKYMIGQNRMLMTRGYELYDTVSSLTINEPNLAAKITQYLG
ncbi:MAG: hypothetical protein DCF18_06910 [Cyanobium sp.]|nr:MAG: hypothetical protein DCF18_06910 [Cyanobium sp.]